MSQLTQSSNALDEEVDIDDAAHDVNWEEAHLLGEQLHVSLDHEGADEDFDNNDTQTIAPPTEPATQPDAVSIPERSIRDQFRTFCFERIFYKAPGWDPSSKLPWGSDKLLLDTINNLNISRRKASMWWLELRRARGCLDDIEVQENEEIFKDRFDDIIRDHAPAICRHSWATVLEMRDKMVMFRTGIDDDFDYIQSLLPDLYALLTLRLHKFNGILARHLSGMTPSNKSSRLASFESEILQSRKKSYLSLCRASFPEMSNEENLRHLFVLIDLNLHSRWNCILNEATPPTPISRVHPNDIEGVVSNASGVLYYISGWILHRMATHRGKSVRVFRAFASVNSLDLSSPDLPSLPTGILDAREKHSGCLKRVNKNFFHLLTVLECLYKLNLRFNDIVWFHRDRIFEKIYDLTKDSEDVRNAFNLCLPPNTPTQDADGVLLFILQTYRNVRAKDFVRLLKRSAGGADNIQFRQSVLVTHLMANGTTPSALRG